MSMLYMFAFYLESRGEIDSLAPKLLFKALFPKWPPLIIDKIYSLVNLVIHFFMCKIG